MKYSADQSELFEGRAAKDEAMARVDAHADEEWKRVMYGLGVEVARRRPQFTTDDLLDAYDATGQTARTHEPRALGPLMTRLAKNGVCRKAKCAPINSRRSVRHCRPLQVWESLIFGRAAA